MDKLQMCRICLAENVDMYVVNQTLHNLYEKLTDNPFVTEDSRPILACFICCAQLKKCYRFMKKCLEAEEMFAKMMNEEYEIKPLINQDQFELFHGFIRTPIDTISIVDVDQTESIVVKEELPAVCERLDDVIEPKEEYESDDDIKAFKIYKNCLPIEYIPQQRSEDDKQDGSKRKRKSNKNHHHHRPINIPTAGTQASSCKRVETPVVKKTNNQEPTAGEKPYKCDKCNASFKGKRGLETHERNHIVGTFQCLACPRIFRTKGHLYQHIRKYNSFNLKNPHSSHSLIYPGEYYRQK